jgi:hypothetical protein
MSVQTASGVTLSATARAFLEQVERLSRAPVYVTSAGRSIESQARAMLGKWRAGEAKDGPGGGAKELHEVYAADDVIDELLRVEKTEAAWADVIRRAVARGVRISRHLAEGAVDLRTRNLSEAQVLALREAVQKLGGKSLLEDAPPHLHVDLPSGAYAAGRRTGYVAAKALESAAPVIVPVAAAAGLLVVGLVLVGVGRRRRAP